MPKRKRDDDLNDPKTGTSRLRATIEQSTRALTAALKLARGFERQKLGRRQKQASNDPKRLLTLREELIVLRQLNLEKTANNYLIKHFSKAKKIRESPEFENLYGSEPRLDPVRPGAEANVIGRLMNSAPVKQTMPGLMTSTFGVLGLQSEQVPANPRSSDTGALQNRQKTDEPLDSFSDGSSVDSNDLMDSGVERTPFNSHEHVLAASDDESDRQSTIDAEEDTLITSPKRSESNARKADTSFLPTLSMGGYYSGSESDEAGIVADTVTTQPRKNRRGQRARQQLAELKHGKKAKHLQNKNQKDSRSSGWDAQRGAVDGIRPPRLGRAGKFNARNPTTRGYDESRTKSTDNDSKPTSKSRDDQGSLHPSWEAAKQRKTQSATQPQFTGKKLTFD